MLICFCMKELFVVGFLFVALAKLKTVLQNVEGKEMNKEGSFFKDRLGKYK